VSGAAPTLLTQASVASFLRERQIGPPRAPDAIEPLSGGISNIVLRIAWPEACIVVKQSLPQLRVAEEWTFDRARLLIERDCMATLGTLLPAGSVPDVVFCDEDRYVLGMTCAPPGGEVWQDALLAGRVDVATAGRVGALLRRLHVGAAARDDLRERFASLMPLEQGRLDPYHRTAAARNPDLAAAIEADVARLLENRRTLVLGDFSPKNVIAYPDRVLLLDFEVAHWGDPAFDAAFMLCHLVLKACSRPVDATAYVRAARELWAAYHGDEPALAREADVVDELGCLLLCRLDGRSPAEYLTAPDARERVRAIARTILLTDDLSLSDVLALVETTNEPARSPA
jgi:aminoglycoside phosphotransferase (APT) family kinase protein